MPSYFFHLKLELYKQPAPVKEHLAAFTSKFDPYIPPPGSDIFKSSLPTHRTTKWSSHHFLNRPDTPHSLSTSGSDSPHRYVLNDYSETHGDALLLPERIPNKKDTPKNTTITPAKPSNEAAARDWRYDLVSIESIDMESSQAKSGVSGLHTKAVYIPSDPKTTEVGWGVVHLYRDSEESPQLSRDAASTPRSGSERSTSGAQEKFDPEDCTTLCILAVPSWMMPADLLGFVGDQAREDVSHFRLIRTERTNKYMVLMKFRSAKKAREWQKANNGRLFSTVEPENCHVVFVKSVEFVSSENAELEKGSGNFPQNNHDPFTAVHRNGYSSRAETNLFSKPPAPPPPNLLELPTCPVCLERMDETTGLLTILCQHVFHCACLEKWRFTGSGCPVCRYTQSPSYTFPYPRPSHDGLDHSHEDDEPMCSVCAKAKSEDATIWICLICGNLGCGRYDSAHAYAHYEATSHCYAMDISTQRVWDYAGDGYVHRLIQNKSQAISESQQNGSRSKETQPRHENEAYRAEGGDMVPREKMESMATEYTYLLTSQLEGQRKYFEEQFERAADKADKACAQAEAAAQQAKKASADMEAALAKSNSLEESTQCLEKALEKAQKAKTTSEQLARKFQTELREERTVIEGLMKRITAADEKAEQAKLQAEKAEEEVKELKDLNHDLATFISSQEKIKELEAQGEQVVDGDVSVPEQVQQGKKKGKGRKK